MTNKDLIMIKKKFAKLAVPEGRIFDEIMRAYYLDCQIFSNPANSENGLSIEELYTHMKSWENEFGVYEGTPEEYATVYTLAMQVNPMDFAPGVVKDGMDMQNFIADLLEELKESGKRILLSGVENYLYRLPWILYELPDKDITVVLSDDTWEKKLSFLFPRRKIISYDEWKQNADTYDFIFHDEKQDLDSIPFLYARLKEKGQMKVLVAYDLLTDREETHRMVRRKMAQEGHVAEYYDLTLEGREWGLLQVMPQEKDHIDFGEARLEGETVKKYKALSLSMKDFIESDDWSYDLYRYNASVALQTLLSAHMLSLEHTVGDVYENVDSVSVMNTSVSWIPKEAWEEDLGLRRDLWVEKKIEEPLLAKVIKKGDILISCDGYKVHMAVVDEDVDVAYTAPEVVVLRPVSYYTGDYLKLYLEGAIGGLFLDVFRVGGHMSLPLPRLMRIPIPASDEEKMKEITKKAKEAINLLSDAGANWRKVKRESVALMLGK